MIVKVRLRYIPLLQRSAELISSVAYNIETPYSYYVTITITAQPIRLRENADQVINVTILCSRVCMWRELECSEKLRASPVKLVLLTIIASDI